MSTIPANEKSENLEQVVESVLKRLEAMDLSERRTDDVPMSKSLITAGYCSPLWTMDCKSVPSATPFNKGELGDIKGLKSDERSAKRKDIEDDGYFSACFSYNKNTKQTPQKQI